MEYVLLIIIVLIYFIPTLNAIGKNRSDAIIMLNILLGWTFIGWIGALIWSMCEGRKNES